MKINKYLSIGTKIAKKYEVVDILGEDDFEILYLVRDLQRKGSFFVLKELFLESFSFRENEMVFTSSEAKGVFEKRKKQIIDELTSVKKTFKHDEIRTYGYEEANGTIYTVMEFSNNASLARYLQYTPNEGVTSLPMLNELLKEQTKSGKFSFLIKLFLLLITLLIVAFFLYNYFQKEYDSKPLIPVITKINHPVLKDREEATEKSVVQEVFVETKTKIEEKYLSLKDDENVSLLSNISENIEQNLTPINAVTNESNISENNETLAEVKEEERISKFIPQISMAVPKEVESRVSIEKRVQSFLEDYISSSSRATIDETLHYYDKRVKRYFKFKNASHKTIRKSMQRYNKKWKYRNFEIVDFKVVKDYKKRDTHYVEVKTTTVWRVSKRRGKNLSGKSRGFMRLKELEDGSFKIVSIYTLK